MTALLRDFCLFLRIVEHYFWQVVLGPYLDLLVPLVDYRRRADNERRTTRRLRHLHGRVIRDEQGDGADRLAETHLVRQN